MEAAVIGYHSSPQQRPCAERRKEQFTMLPPALLSKKVLLPSRVEETNGKLTNKAVSISSALERSFPAD